MKTIQIISEYFFDEINKKITLGGVQTYIFELANILSKKYNVIVHELSDNNFIENIDGFIIKGTNKYKNYQSFFNSIYNVNDVFIISTDQLPIRSKGINVISIQHGIAFDIPRNFFKNRWSKWSILVHINKTLRCIRNIVRFHNINNTVCVDYNYFNWIRTLSWIESPKKVTVIPNFTSSIKNESEIKEKLSKNRERISILFARRFVDYRGTLLFIEIVDKLINKYDNIDFTFAGNGPLKDLIIDKFASNKRVNITSFESKDSVDFHYGYDIAIIPTIFSEGTSLSLCEAMAAGCFPICTYVGGMSNMIIDGFNGYIVFPDKEHLYESIINAINLEKKILIR